jgi:mannose-6-phosphate isomerase-like protein (cupin superfamily)
MTTVVPQQRIAVGRHGRELEVILASASPGPATILACAVPPATSGPPLHVHAASEETFFVLSGVLLVHAGGQLAAIPEGGLVHIGRGMPHTFATTPGSPARFLMLHTSGTAGGPCTAAAHTMQDHGGDLPHGDITGLTQSFGRQLADPPKQPLPRPAKSRPRAPPATADPSRRSHPCTTTGKGPDSSRHRMRENPRPRLRPLRPGARS